jgi:hypothetical protein
MTTEIGVPWLVALLYPGAAGCASPVEEAEDDSTASLTAPPSMPVPTDVRLRGTCSVSPDMPLRTDVTFDLDPGVRPPLDSPRAREWVRQ